MSRVHVGHGLRHRHGHGVLQTGGMAVMQIVGPGKQFTFTFQIDYMCAEPPFRVRPEHTNPINRAALRTRNGFRNEFWAIPRASPVEESLTCRRTEVII